MIGAAGWEEDVRDHPIPGSSLVVMLSRSRRLSMNRGYLIALIVLSALSLLSLALNGIVIVALLDLRQSARRIVVDTQEFLTQIADDTFSYTVELDRDVPVSAEVPFNEAFSVPINTVIPISTTVQVPVDLGFTTYRLTVPIETVVPVDLELTVPVSQVVDITTVVPLQVDVPIEVAVAETPLAEYLRDVDALLERAEEQLGRPIWQGD
jgi:hypothetical protein